MKRFLAMLAVVAMLHGAGLVGAQNPGGQTDKGQKDAQPPKDAKVKSGLTINDPKAFQGYTLFSPMNSNTTYLIDLQAKVVKTWTGAASPAMSAYLLPNGNLFRPCTPGAGKGKGGGGIAGAGGRVQEFNWDGEVVWDYLFPIDTQMPHHDMIKMPNGNVLAIVSFNKSAEESVAAGRRTSAVMRADSLFEIKPKGKDGGEIIWQWNAWDHAIQDNDAAKANHGSVAEHPELIDINYNANFGGAMGKGKDGDKGKGKDKGGPPPKAGPDWNHLNCVAYNADLDQIMVSVHSFSEFWIIDHATTTAEAASHKGGKQGKGGDLLYRWGNPQAYRAGKAADQQLYFQHNAHWIPSGLPGAGNVLVFNNGTGRPGGNYSQVDEIVPPVDKKGSYTHKAGAPFGPEKAAWSYTAEKKSDFFATNISGAQRLANGHTLICSGTNATIFEVTPKSEIVWKFAVTGGGGPGGKGPGPFDPKKGDFKDKKDFDKKDFGQKKDFDPKKDFGKQPPPGGKGGGGGSLFRALRYAPEYPAFVDRKLTPGKSFEESLLKDKGK